MFNGASILFPMTEKGFPVLPIRIKLEGETKAVSSCSFSSDGAKIISSLDNDSSLKIWEVNSGRCLRPLEGHTAAVRCCAFSKDEKLIVAGLDNKELRVWETTSLQCIQELKGHLHWINCCSFSPNSDKIVSGSADNTLKVWSLQDGGCIMTLTHMIIVECCCFSSSGLYILSGSGLHTLTLWNAQNGNIIHTLRGHTHEVSCCAISPNEQYIVSGSGDKNLQLWELQSGAPTHTLTGHQDKINCVCYSSDGFYIVSGAADATLRIWESHTGGCIFTSKGGVVVGCYMSPDDKYIAAVSKYDNTLLIWQSNALTSVTPPTMPPTVTPTIQSIPQIPLIAFGVVPVPSTQSTKELSATLYTARIPKSCLKFEHQIGKGAFSTVYKGIWSKSSSESMFVAIKSLDIAESGSNRSRFLKEVEIMLQLKHHNVLECLGIEDGSYSLVLEYIDGGSLYTFLQDSGGLNHDLCLSFTKQAITAAMYIHQCGVIHKDIKSANWLLTKHNTLKLCDFGMSTIRTMSHKSNQIIGGSIRWRAPETYSSPKTKTNGKWTFKADIFAIILFFLYFYHIFSVLE